MPRGFSLLEIIIAVGVLGIIIGTFVSVNLFFQLQTLETQQNIEAEELLQETLEALRTIRDSDWSSFSPGQYGLSRVDNDWQLVADSDTTSGFTRSIIISQIDDNRLDFNISLSWQTPLAKSRSLTGFTRLTNWRTPIAEESSQTYTLSGEIDKRHHLSFPYLHMALSGDNSYAVADVSNPAQPQVIYLGSFGARARHVYVDGNYSFLAMEDNKVRIFDVSDPANPSEVATIFLSYRPNAVFVTGGYLYIGQANRRQGLVIYNVANPQTPVYYRSYRIGAPVNDVVVQGGWIFMAINLGMALDIDSANYIAYVAVALERWGLWIYNWRFAPRLRLMSLRSINGKGSGVRFDGNRVYLSVEKNNNGLATLDISNPYKPILLESRNIGGKGNWIVESASDLYLAVENSNQTFVIISKNDLP